MVTLRKTTDAPRILIDRTHDGLSVPTDLNGPSLAWQIDSLGAAVDAYWHSRTAPLRFEWHTGRMVAA